MSGKVRIAVADATAFLAALFAQGGLAAPAAAEMAQALVEADVEGLPSHGLSQAGMYLRRLQLGSLPPFDTAEVVQVRGATAVLDARGMFGHLAGRQAMALAARLAGEHGAGVVAVRNSFHFGAAGRYARMASEAGCIGLAMCNTKPMMPAPGGAAAVAGNNPLAIGVPAHQPDFLLDMAMSEAALGRIRAAAAAGQPIPPGWAVDKAGAPTTDAEAAIAGMLLPAGGAKGFGLALAIDLMCSHLADGPGGAEVAPLYGDLSRPFLCSLLFIAIDVGHFRAEAAFRDAAAASLDAVRRAPFTSAPARIPGARGAALRTAATIDIPAALAITLDSLAEESGVTARLMAVADAARSQSATQGSAANGGGC